LHNGPVTVLRALGVVLRLVVSVLLSFFLVQLAVPLPDPVLVDSAWLLLIVVLMLVEPTRLLIGRWITTGRLRRPPVQPPAGVAGDA
jgi:hypothetical protein